MTITKNRTEKLLKDIALFAIASFAPKILSFFLVPLYTSHLSAEAYGIADVLNTIYSLILPILMVDISDAILIATVERNEVDFIKEGPLQYGMSILCKTTTFLLGISIIIAYYVKIDSIQLYVSYVFFQYVLNALYNNMIAYLKGIDDTKHIVISSIINSLITLLSNIIFIYFLKLGLFGLLIASILGGIFSNSYLLIKLKVLTLCKKSKKLNSEEKKEMLKYSIPLIFTGLAWWINSSSDRLFITIFSGVALNGIYAIANKIPTILNACHSIIYQAMQLSVFKENSANDKEKFLNQLYEIYCFVMIFVCGIIIAFDKFLAKILFKGDFYVAWKYCPALLISIVCFSIAGYLITLYAAEKETKLIAKTTVIGALINSILNILLIPKYQLYGAVIATMIGYYIIWFILAIKSKNVIGINIRFKKSIVGIGLLLIQWICLLILSDNYFIQGTIIVIICILYNDIITNLVNVIRKIVNNRSKLVSEKE